MSISELETDPLVAEDPLDCSNEIIKIGHLQENWIRFEPNFHLEGVVVEIKNVAEAEDHRLPPIKSTKITSAKEGSMPEVEWQIENIRTKERRDSLSSCETLPKSGDATEYSENSIGPLKRRKSKRINGRINLSTRRATREKDFPCERCERTFPSASVLKEHVSNFCQPYSCENCLEVFCNRKTFAKHLKTAHSKSLNSVKDEKHKKDDDGSLTEKIPTSNEKNKRSRKYYEQLKTERKYHCEICQKTFITSGHLTTHLYRHSDKKWTCDGCGKNFSCERSLMRHKDTFPEDHWFPCKLCDVTFFRASNIAKHMEIKHPEAVIDTAMPKKNNKLEKPTINENLKDILHPDISNQNITCDKSSETFSNTEEYIVHKDKFHPYEKSEVSTLIEGAKENEDRSKTSSEGDFTNYVRNYKCDVCSKEFVSLEGYEYHKNHQHVEKEVRKKRRKKADDEVFEGTDKPETDRPNFVCKICSVPFVFKSALQTHLKSHNVTKNMEVKSGSHQCCICPRSFTSSDGLKYHLATHTGERRYSCSQCGKRFIKKTHLSEHIATHSEVKYFKCPRCPRTFSTHSAYRKHIKHFPGIHSFPCNKCGKLFTKESMIEKHMCVDLIKITMAPEVKALLSEDMIEEYLCMAEEQMAQELSGQNQKKKSSVNNTSYSCYKCFKVFPNVASLQMHQKEHIGKQNYQCRFCPESFKRADAFGAHIRNHLGSTPYMCLKCNRKFISPFTLSMHAKNYPGDHSFVCQKCQRWFPSETRLEKHECILQNSDHFRCACGSTFSSWNELLKHAGTKPYKCCSCELIYPTLMALARHIKKHTGVKPFTCEVCGKSFRAKNNYLNHKNIHRNAKEFQCEHCKYKSKSQKRLNFHLYRKHDIGSNVAKSTLCPICGVIFPYISHMKKHLELEHGNELTLDEYDTEKKTLPAELCTLCGKMLNNKYTLANHMKKVHDPNAPKKERLIKCEFCEEKFHTVKKLQRHAEIHEAPGLRSCEICHKEFYFAKDLRKHMRKHDTNKPFSCPFCGKQFKVSVSLKYHSTICGNDTQRSSRGSKKKEAKEPLPIDVLYGHINPPDPMGQLGSIHVYDR